MQLDPLKKRIKFIRSDRITRPRFSLTIEEISNAIHFAADDHYFTLNQITMKRIVGVPMGGSME